LRGCLESANFRIGERFQHRLNLCRFCQNDQQ
jgi:hypothetical protein